MSDEVQRALGRLETAVAVQGDQVKRLEVKVDRLCSTVDQAKGGWKVLAAAATAGGVLGAFLTKVTSMLLVIPR